MRLNDYSLSVGKTELFSGVTVNFQNGTLNHLLGGNGVGKSSFAKSLAKMLEYKGEVIYEGTLCVIGSYTNVPSDLTINNLKTILKHKSELHFFDELYELLRIKEVDNDLKVGKMSDGQKQKVKLLVFLSSAPDIIILDEFTSSLDKKSMLDIYNFINQYRATRETLIINITHNIVDLENLSGNYYYVTQKKIVPYSEKQKLIEDYTKLN
jgi:putative peptide transport system ATP-binding protein